MKYSFLSGLIGLAFSFTVIANPIPSPQKKIIDLNTAEVSDLVHCIKGIGNKRAEAIVAYRKTHQRFSSVEELSQVRGLGPSFVKNHLDELKNTFTVSKKR